MDLTNRLPYQPRHHGMPPDIYLPFNFGSDDSEDDDDVSLRSDTGIFGHGPPRRRRRYRHPRHRVPFDGPHHRHPFDRPPGQDYYAPGMSNITNRDGEGGGQQRTWFDLSRETTESGPNSEWRALWPSGSGRPRGQVTADEHLDMILDYYGPLHRDPMGYRIPSRSIPPFHAGAGNLHSNTYLGSHRFQVQSQGQGQNDRIRPVRLVDYLASPEGRAEIQAETEAEDLEDYNDAMRAATTRFWHRERSAGRVEDLDLEHDHDEYMLGQEARARQADVPFEFWSDRPVPISTSMSMPMSAPMSMSMPGRGRGGGGGCEGGYC